jgi:hypothetical protein
MSRHRRAYFATKRALDVVGSTTALVLLSPLLAPISEAFEINPRFSGSAPFRALVGFNEPHLVIQNRLTGQLATDLSIRTGVFGVRSFAERVIGVEERAGVRWALE